MRSSDLAGNCSACLFFSLSQWKKGWVIQTAASASGLGPGSVSTLFFAPPGTSARLELPTRVPRGGERSEISFKEANGRGRNKKEKGPPRDEKRERARSPRKASFLPARLTPSLSPGSPTRCTGAGPRSPEGICGHRLALSQPSLRSEVQLGEGVLTSKHQAFSLEGKELCEGLR